MSNPVVTDQDVAFARALVALCREHKMTGFQLEYRPNFELGSALGQHETRKVNWAEGRHGAGSQIRFRLEAESSFGEQP
jgi:hypothetical protein